MAYQPGPFRLQPGTRVFIEPGNYDFTDFSVTELSPIDGLLADIDALYAAMAAETIFDIIDPLDDADLTGAVIEWATQFVSPVIPDMDIMLAGVTEADGLLDGAVSAAPAEAWTDPPEPFHYPFLSPTLPAAGVEPGAFVPGTGVPTTTPPPTPLPTRALSLLNLSVYGNRNFTILDTWLVQATGNAGDAVELHAYVNGNDIGQETVGSIGVDGRFELSGTFGPSDVGSWREDWYVGGQFIVSYNFIVSSS